MLWLKYTAAGVIAYANAANVERFYSAEDGNNPGTYRIVADIRSGSSLSNVQLSAGYATQAAADEALDPIVSTFGAILEGN